MGMAYHKTHMPPKKEWRVKPRSTKFKSPLTKPLMRSESTPEATMSGGGVHYCIERETSVLARVE